MSIVPPDETVSLWVDFGPEFGVGHLYRCRGLIEYLSELGCQIDLFAAISIREIEWVKKLEGAGTVSIRNKVISKFFMQKRLIVDSYNLEVNEWLIRHKLGRAVRIMDSTEHNSFVNPMVMEVLLESGESTLSSEIDSMRFSDIGGQEIRRLRGTLIWNSRLNEVAKGRMHLANKTSSEEGKVIVLSYGGSGLVHNALHKTINVISTSPKFCQIKKIVCFAREEVITEFKSQFMDNEKLDFKIFGDEFYVDLSSCDLLISASGTTALEAYHLGIPSLIVELFENASKNVDLLTHIFANSIVVENAIFNDSSLFKNAVESALSSLEPISPTLSGTLQASELDLIYQHLFS